MIFEGKSKQDLYWHMSENHGWPKEKESADLDSSQGVRYCSKCNYEDEDLDAHTWDKHNEEDFLPPVCNFCDEAFQTI